MSSHAGGRTWAVHLIMRQRLRVRLNYLISFAGRNDACNAHWVLQSYVRLMMNLVLALVNVGIMAWLAWLFFRWQGNDRKRVFWLALSFRVAGGVALGLLYFYHYAVGDTLSYWEDGNRLMSAFFESPGSVVQFYWEDSAAPEIINALQQQTPRSIFFVKICGLLAGITGGNYWIMATWLSLLSFAGSWFLFERLARFFPEATSAAAVSLLFIPSVVFWSSGLIKESLGMAALSVLAAGSLSIAKGQRVSVAEGLLIVVSLWVGWNLKYYWIGIFLPSVFPVLAVGLIVRKFPAVSRFDGVLWALLFGVFLFVATNTHPNFYASRFLEVIYHNNLEFTRMSAPPRIVQYLNLEPEVVSVMMNAPAALLAGLFRPFVWEAFNALSWLAALENMLILILVVQALASVKHVFLSGQRMLLLSALTYVLLLITFLALSTPNFGTLSRYRIGALPVAVLLCLLPATPLGRWLGSRKWFG